MVKFWKGVGTGNIAVVISPKCHSASGAPGTQSVHSFIHAADIEHLLCTRITFFRGESS